MSQIDAQINIWRACVTLEQMFERKGLTDVGLSQIFNATWKIHGAVVYKRKKLCRYLLPCKHMNKCKGQTTER